MDYDKMADRVRRCRTKSRRSRPNSRPWPASVTPPSPAPNLPPGWSGRWGSCGTSATSRSLSPICVGNAHAGRSTPSRKLRDPDCEYHQMTPEVDELRAALASAGPCAHEAARAPLEARIAELNTEAAAAHDMANDYMKMWKFERDRRLAIEVKWCKPGEDIGQRLERERDERDRRISALESEITDVMAVINGNPREQRTR